MQKEKEIEETERFLSQATFPALQQVLKSHLSNLKKEATATAAAGPPAATTTTAASAPPPPPAAAPIRPSIVSDRAPSSSSSVTYVPVTGTWCLPPPPPWELLEGPPCSRFGRPFTFPPADFAWDQGTGYATPTVSVFVELPGVGEVKDNVAFSCTPTSFDLKVHGLGGKNYRLLKDNLEKDIVPADSKIVVKRDKVVIKLQKKKGDYSYEHWSALTAKKKRDADGNTKKDPMGGLMVRSGGGGGGGRRKRSQFTPHGNASPTDESLTFSTLPGHDEGHVRRWGREHEEDHRGGHGTRLRLAACAPLRLSHLSSSSLSSLRLPPIQMKSREGKANPGAPIDDDM